MRLQLKFIFVFFIGACNASGQNTSSEAAGLPAVPPDSLQKDTTKWKDLDAIKVNFVYSYYEQDGIHSPVTGGVGDEALLDHVVKMTVSVPVKKWFDVSLMAGLDIYTSASTDNINNEHDFYVETSASFQDERKYCDGGVLFNDKESGIDYGVNFGYSKEWDVESVNGGAYIAKTSKNKNTQLKLQGSFYKDQWDLIYPVELRPVNGSDLLDVEIKWLYDVSLTWSQVVNKRFQYSLSLEGVYQEGLLSTPFHRVYFSDLTHDIERLPKQRRKLPIGLFANWYMNDFALMRFYYRWYIDDWGILANTIQLDVPMKVAKAYVVTPFYRFHQQYESKYLRAFGTADPNETYYSSDYDLSGFHAHKVGLDVRYSPVYGLRNKVKDQKKHNHLKFKSMSVRAAKYFRYDYSGIILKSFIVSTALTFDIK